MERRNTFVKINLKSSGYGFVWQHDNPNLDVDQYLPKTFKNLTGPNLAFSSTRISTNTFFLATISRWRINDEYDRKGIILAQGYLLEANGDDSSQTVALCQNILGLLRVHEFSFHYLGEWLEHLARNGNESEAKSLIDKTEKLSNIELDGTTSELINELASYIQKEQSQSPDDRFRIYTEFPWPPELGFCALVGSQVSSPIVKSVGGGHLSSLQTYQHISTSQENAGFKYIDLNRVLSSKDSSRGFMCTTNREMDMNKSGWDKLLAFTPIVSTIILSCLGLYFIYSFNSNQRSVVQALNSIAERLPQNDVTKAVDQGKKPVPSIQPQQEPAPANQQSQSEDLPLLQNIAKLYDANWKVRNSMIVQLQRDQSSHERLIPLAIKYGKQNQANDNGIENTCRVFQKINPEILKSHRGEVVDFIDTVKNKNEVIKREANKVSLLIGNQ